MRNSRYTSLKAGALLALASLTGIAMPAMADVNHKVPNTAGYVRVGSYLLDPKVKRALDAYFGVYATRNLEKTTTTINGKVVSSETRDDSSQTPAIDNKSLEELLPYFDENKDHIITSAEMDDLASKNSKR